jgi:Zn finger protein HypA/HybF involved in hydrogenase expression
MKVVNCSKCNNTFAVYGISYFCPFCGFDVFLENIEQIKKKMKLQELTIDFK